MNVFNRIFLVLLLLALAVGAVAIIVLAWSAPNDSIANLRDAVDWLQRNNKDFEKSLLTIGCIVVVLVCLILIGLELVPGYGPDVKVTDLEIGDAVLSTAAIGQRVEEGVREVPHVSDVKAQVKARRKGVDLFLDLHVDPDANLAEVTNASCEAARAMLNERVHVALAHPPKARLHYRELRLSRSGGMQQQPAAPETPSEEEPRAAGEEAPPATTEPTTPEASATDETTTPPAEDTETKSE